MLAEAILARKPDTGLRRFEMRRDLKSLADLIDLTFGFELDEARSPIVAEMRRLAKAGPLLWLLDASYATLAPLLGGFVWMDGGKLVGNVTLSPESGQRGLVAITNMAVHPDFRRQGIGRRLMEAALDEAGHRGARAVVLEVRTDGAAAQLLYRELGFKCYHTVTELRLAAAHRPGPRSALLHPPLALRQRRPGDRQKLYHFYQAVTPAALQDVRPVLSRDYRIDIGLRLSRWLESAMYRRQRSDWILERTGPLQAPGESHAIGAVLQVTGEYTDAPHRLQVDVHPECRAAVEDELVAAGLSRLSGFPDRDVVSTVSASHPEGLAALQRAGFAAARTLDQMVLWNPAGRTR